MKLYLNNACMLYVPLGNSYTRENLMKIHELILELRPGFENWSRFRCGIIQRHTRGNVNSSKRVTGVFPGVNVYVLRGSPVHHVLIFTLREPIIIMLRSLPRSEQCRRGRTEPTWRRGRRATT